VATALPVTRRVSARPCPAIQRKEYRPDSGDSQAIQREISARLEFSHARLGNSKTYLQVRQADAVFPPERTPARGGLAQLLRAFPQLLTAIDHALGYYPKRWDSALRSPNSQVPARGLPAQCTGYRRADCTRGSRLSADSNPLYQSLESETVKKPQFTRGINSVTPLQGVVQGTQQITLDHQKSPNLAHLQVRPTH